MSPRTKTVLTVIVGLVIAGGMLRLATDQRRVEVALPESDLPESEGPASLEEKRLPIPAAARAARLSDRE